MDETFSVPSASLPPVSHFRMKKEASWLLFDQFPLVKNCLDVRLTLGRPINYSLRPKMFLTFPLSEEWILNLRPSLDLQKPHGDLELVYRSKSKGISMLVDLDGNLQLGALTKLKDNWLNAGSLWASATANTRIQSDQLTATSWGGSLRWQLPPRKLVLGNHSLPLAAGVVVAEFNTNDVPGSTNPPATVRERFSLSYVQQYGDNLILGAGVTCNPDIRVNSGHTLRAGPIRNMRFGINKPKAYIGGAFYMSNGLLGLLEDNTKSNSFKKKGSSAKGIDSNNNQALLHVRAKLGKAKQKVSLRLDQKLYSNLSVFGEVHVNATNWHQTKTKLCAGISLFNL